MRGRRREKKGRARREGCEKGSGAKGDMRSEGGGKTYFMVDIAINEDKTMNLRHRKIELSSLRRTTGFTK